MTIKVVLADPDGGAAHFEDYRVNSSDARSLSVTSIAQSHGAWKSTNGSTAAITAVTSPDNGGSIAITDIMLSTEKKTSGEVELRFTDGTNTIILFRALLTQFPVQINQGIVGLMKGWKDARVEIETVQNFEYSITIGYIKFKEGLDYSEWDARR